MTAPPATQPPAHTKASRADWIDAAVTTLIEEGVDQVKVLSLAQKLDVSRSSFYWYFKERRELLDELLSIWGTNTASIVERSLRGAPTIVDAVLGVFECWADERLFDPRLDFAVRDWARRDDKVREAVLDADQVRVDAIATMFAGHGYGRNDCVVRARMLYHSQVGYYAVGTNESADARLGYLPHYLTAMTGSEANEAQLEDFARFWAYTGDNSASAGAEGH